MKVVGLSRWRAWLLRGLGWMFGLIALGAVLFALGGAGALAALGAADRDLMLGGTFWVWYVPSAAVWVLACLTVGLAREVAALRASRGVNTITDKDQSTVLPSG